MITSHIIKYKHHNLRICGYLDFYQSTYQHIRTPLFASSVWNTFFLFLAAILHHTHKINYDEYCRQSEIFTPVNYILLLTTMELMIIVPVYINYISKYLISFLSFSFFFCRKIIICWFFFQNEYDDLIV